MADQTLRILLVDQNVTRASILEEGLREAGYTNVFACQEQANPLRWSGATGDKRFYVKLRNGQMYGRIVINLYADFHGKPMIRISYAVNPSGSRILREQVVERPYRPPGVQRLENQLVFPILPDSQR